MNWKDSISDLLRRYSGVGGGTAAAPENPQADYEQVARTAPQDVVAGGLAEAFRSDQTPAFPQLLSNLFNHSDPNQRAGLLNSLLGAAGPGALASLPGLSGILGGGGQVTPEQASRVSPQEVEQVAAQAQQKDPSIIDQISSFYAQHPQVVKALGGAVLAIAVQHMTRRK